MARQFNLIPPVCEQAEYHLFQREKVEVQLPELYHKIGKCSLRVCQRLMMTCLVPKQVSTEHSCTQFVIKGVN